MNLQYISDSKGKTTGVFIPIKEWVALKSKYNLEEQEEIDIPGWHIDEVRKRLENYRNKNDQPMDFDEVIDQIEKEL